MRVSKEKINVFLFIIRLITVIAYIYIYSQLQVYFPRHMILVNFMFTPDEFGYIKITSKINTLSILATTRHVYFPFRGINEKSFFEIS